MFKKGDKTNLGKYHSAETKEKLRKSNLQRYKNGEKFGFQKGHPFYLTKEILKNRKKARYWLGKKLSKEHREKLSKSHIGKCGKNASNWKGDKAISPKNERIRKSVEFRLWREAVFARDNWTCQKYGIKGGKLHPHHIQNFAEYPELRFAIDNGITLSKKAHKEFHKKYGNKNNTKEQLETFLIITNQTKQCLDTR